MVAPKLLSVCFLALFVCPLALLFALCSVCLLSLSVCSVFSSLYSFFQSTAKGHMTNQHLCSALFSSHPPITFYHTHLHTHNIHILLFILPCYLTPHTYYHTHHTHYPHDHIYTYTLLLLLYTHNYHTLSHYHIITLSHYHIITYPTTIIGYLLPEMFLDKNYGLLFASVLSTSNCGSNSLDLFGFGPVVDSGFGLGYMIHPTSLHVCVTNFHGQVTKQSYLTTFPLKILKHLYIYIFKLIF